MRKETDFSSERLRRENDFLRVLATKIMPCHYCGVKEISLCPHGFPGCALMDDILCAEDRANEYIRELQAEIARLRSDCMIAAMRLMGDNADTFAPETLGFMDRWRPLVEMKWPFK